MKEDISEWVLYDVGGSEDSHFRLDNDLEQISSGASQHSTRVSEELNGILAGLETNNTFTVNGSENEDLEELISSLIGNSDNIVLNNGSTTSGTNTDHGTLPVFLDQFFIQNGARMSPIPCTHCSRYRLQCLILQTTHANPNPISSCSSCVALFRECSLSQGGGKRPASQFETPDPVIGQLHGVNEEVSSFTWFEDTMKPIDVDQTPSLNLASSESLTKSRVSARVATQTRSLRSWLNAHKDHPYPTDEQKALLVSQSGLTKTQVNSWFTNARRRQRQSARALSGKTFFMNGSPMPSLLSNLSPLERWRNSPPEDEHISPAIIESAIASSNIFSEPLFYDNGELRASSESSQSAYTGSITYSNSPSMWGSSASDGSSYSHHSGDQNSTVAISRRSFNRRSKSSHRSRLSKIKSYTYQCTFCHRVFGKRHDWLRHERSVHMPSLESYVCEGVPILAPDQKPQVWRLNKPGPECTFCGHPSPDQSHFESHGFETCVERDISERTFARKDHLWQHLSKFHGCRKWDGWACDLALWCHKRNEVRSRCGFCNLEMFSWSQRADHLAEHFRKGSTMEQWSIGAELEESLMGGRHAGGMISSGSIHTNRQSSSTGDLSGLFQLDLDVQLNI